MAENWALREIKGYLVFHLRVRHQPATRRNAWVESTELWKETGRLTHRSWVYGKDTLRHIKRKLMPHEPHFLYEATLLYRPSGETFISSGGSWNKCRFGFMQVWKNHSFKHVSENFTEITSCRKCLRLLGAWRLTFSKTVSANNLFQTHGKAAVSEKAGHGWVNQGLGAKVSALKVRRLN